jgi:hypothetical protein
LVYINYYIKVNNMLINYSYNNEKKTIWKKIKINSR